MYYRSISSLVNTHPIIIGLILLFVYHLPYLVLGNNVLYNIGDNLDSNIVFYKLIGNSNYFFSFSNKIFIDAFLGGSIPRNALPSSLNFTSWAFFLFEPSVAYPLLRFIFTFGAFLGMYYFLENH